MNNLYMFNFPLLNNPTETKDLKYKANSKQIIIDKMNLS